MSLPRCLDRVGSEIVNVVGFASTVTAAEGLCAGVAGTWSVAWLTKKHAGEDNNGMPEGRCRAAPSRGWREDDLAG